jgi:hypothetical protein
MRLRFSYEPTEYGDKTCIISLSKDNIPSGTDRRRGGRCDPAVAGKNGFLTPPSEGIGSKNKIPQSDREIPADRQTARRHQ